jgi:hypothetical protein
VLEGSYALPCSHAIQRIQSVKWNALILYRESENADYGFTLLTCSITISISSGFACVLITLYI